MSIRQITVRDVIESDLVRLVEIEEQVWVRIGAPAITHEVLMQWLRLGTSFFLVAEHAGEVVGYYFGQYNSFDLSIIGMYIDIDKSTAKGYIITPHDERGDSLYGVTISSVVPGAGSALYTVVLDRLKREHKKFYFGYCRLSGFDAYINSLDPTSREFAENNLDATALWYARKSMEAIGGLIWDQCDPLPDVDLPPPPPDPILAFHNKCCGGRFGLVHVLSRFMPCIESRGYAAFLVLKNDET